MITSIPRHDHSAIDTTLGVEGLVRAVDWALERLDRSDVARAKALGTTLTHAKTRCAVDPNANQFETWEAWVTAMQVGSARFAMATAPEGSTVTCRIKEKEFHLPATGSQSYVNAGTWVTSFYLALICHEKERLRELAEVPVSLLRASGAVFDEYIYSWVETLQGFWLGRTDVGDNLVAAVQGTGPDSAQYADQEFLSKILHPPIILFYHYLREDHDEFNDALVDALRWHKSYWSADEDRAITSDGFVALGPLAIACLALDSGFPINVESAYLPKSILNFAWRGEIDM
ncbi:immunity 49 family protein [Streptomyces sp. NPDC008313]|uniref:immunity 49 family protein n=1 Tax=Streptomyces sp. NPDC008313 TaxID=3364826 RepID=UPI0036E7CF06